MAITLSDGTLDLNDIKDLIINLPGQEDIPCTHPAGHCYGSDGGSGIPDNLKVAVGRGGSGKVWRLSPNKQTILERLVYVKCQYCEKYYVTLEPETPRDI